MKTKMQKGVEMRDHRMAAARKKTRLTQQALASLVGLSESQITKIETGRRRTSEDEAEKIATVLNVRPWEIFSR